VSILANLVQWKQGACSRGEHLKAHPLRQAPAKPSNIRLCFKRMPGTNSLAYSVVFWKRRKKFDNMVSWCKCYETFFYYLWHSRRKARAFFIRHFFGLVSNFRVMLGRLFCYPTSFCINVSGKRETFYNIVIWLGKMCSEFWPIASLFRTSHYMKVNYYTKFHKFNCQCW